MYQEPPESLEQQSDQAVLPNLNAQWVNAKGESFMACKSWIQRTVFAANWKSSVLILACEQARG